MDYLVQHIADPSSWPLGANQYAAWRVLIGPPSSSGQSLTVKTKSETVPAGLLKAAESISKRGGRAKFCQQLYLLKPGDVNQRVVKGVGTALLSISATASVTQLSSAVQIIQWLEQHDIKTKFNAEWQSMAQHVNDVLKSVSWGLQSFKHVFIDFLSGLGEFFLLCVFSKEAALLIQDLLESEWLLCK